MVAGVINGFGFGILMPTGQAAINNLVKSSEKGLQIPPTFSPMIWVLELSPYHWLSFFDKVSLAEIYRYSTLLIMLAAIIFVFKAIPHYYHNIRDRKITPQFKS